MKVLVINAGSSSLKYQLIDTENEYVIAKGICERIAIGGSVLCYKPTGKDPIEVKKDMKNHTDAVKMVLDALIAPDTGVIKSMSEIGAVGHRIVHGGERFSSSVLITDEIIKTIEELSELAPLHNPANLMGIRACKEIMPDVPMVGVFDTAFHQTMPPEAYLYGLSYDAYREMMIRRYGFHGTSHYYVSRRAIELLGKPEHETRIVTCHLGNGSSITAVKGGKSIDTSMGFTPLEGVPMGTRCGNIDPAIVMYLMDKKNWDIKKVKEYMNKKSGMLGISGVSSDFRDLSAASESGNERAKIAVDLFCYHVKKYIGAYSAAMNGLDAIVFTAGVGENDREVREKILAGLDFLGVDTDFELNRNCPRGKEAVITKPGSKVKVFVIPTDEEMVIARDTAALAKR
ncbi:MAG: Acetate kinase [Firmicutes bacterium ADurb.Bin182]|nr:MAG: Acetate kinase [Firmicutes bacterium ADurb.Bin182]